MYVIGLASRARGPTGDGVSDLDQLVSLAAVLAPLDRQADAPKPGAFFCPTPFAGWAFFILRGFPGFLLSPRAGNPPPIYRREVAVSTNFDYDRASRVLAAAAFSDDTTATRDEGITTRTLQRYRKRLAEDPVLSQLVAQKKAVLEREWAHKIAPALRSALDFLARAGREANPADPEAIHAIAGAFKLVNEGGLAKAVIDARLGHGSRPDAQPGRQADPAPHQHTN